VSGFPITDELVTSDHRGRRSEFQYASMYWSRHSGAHEIHGHRNRAQGIRGLFGYPITDETPTQYGSRGAFNNFEHGAIHWSFRNGIESSTRCPHFAPCRAGPRFNGTCNPIATLDDLRRQANERLSATDRAIGELTTPLKRGEIIANRLDDEGMLRPQRRGQAGAITAVVDRWLWTGDVFLDQFPVEGRISRPSAGRVTCGSRSGRRIDTPITKSTGGRRAGASSRASRWHFTIRAGCGRRSSFAAPTSLREQRSGSAA
jgi:hypothetical protein